MNLLVFYGGDGGTHPRDELLAWLRGPAVKLDARVVADEPPHSKGSVDDRVDDAIAWADAAIAILTPDSRSPHGAPNVMDEIGRWRGAKGKATLLVLRRQGVEPYSNHAGLVYAGFKDRVSEASEKIRQFLGSLSESATAAADASFVIDSSGAAAMIGSHFFEHATIIEAGSQTTVVLNDLSDRDVSNVRALSANSSMQVAYANTAIQATLRDREIRHEAGKGTVRLVFTDARNGEYGGALMEMAWGGSPAKSADEIAALRTSRVLFNDPPASKDPIGVEMLIAGGHSGGLRVEESPLDRFVANLPHDQPLTWQLARLVLIARLRLSNCVERIDALRLSVVSGHLSRIEFKGHRARRYTNVEPACISFDRTLP